MLIFHPTLFHPARKLALGGLVWAALFRGLPLVPQSLLQFKWPQALGRYEARNLFGPFQIWGPLLWDWP